MITILFESEQGKKLKSFRTLTWNSSNNLPETATKTFWRIDTNVRKFNFIEYLKMEHFFFGLNLELQRSLFDAPGVLSDDLFVELLIAKQQVENQELLLQRLNILRKLQGKKEWNLNLLFTLRGNLSFRMWEVRSAIRTATKFSGYVRNSSAVGSKSPKSLIIPEPETLEWNNVVKIDFLSFLTVGEFTSGPSGDIFLTLTRTKSSKRSPKKKSI